RVKADVKIQHITRPIPIIIDRLQQLERVIVDVSETSEIRVHDKRYRATHHHSQHIPCRRKRPAGRHQPFTYPFYRRYDRDNILHPLHACLECGGGFLVDLLKPVYDPVFSGRRRRARQSPFHDPWQRARGLQRTRFSVIFHLRRWFLLTTSSTAYSSRLNLCFRSAISWSLGLSASTQSISLGPTWSGNAFTVSAGASLSDLRRVRVINPQPQPTIIR